MACKGPQVLTFLNRQPGVPFVAEEVESYQASSGYVWMENSGRKPHNRRSEGVVVSKIYAQEEYSLFKRSAALTCHNVGKIRSLRKTWMYYNIILTGPMTVACQRN